MAKVSIISINLNNVLGLQKTLKSVIEQTFNSFEYIVIDGNSSDDSVNVIRQYESKLAYWISEPDSGIYQAMNKGICRATGEYCLFLNSGDWFTGSDILQKVFAENYEADIISGDIFYYNSQTDEIKWHILSPDFVTAKNLFFGTLPHQATFIRRSLFKTIGFYNEQLKIASDWYFFLEALLAHGCTYQHHKGTIAYFNMDGISCSPQSISSPRKEQISILRQKYPLFLADYEYFDQLEKQNLHWLASREYKVYCFLERFGIIRLGVIARSIKRIIYRNT